MSELSGSAEKEKPIDGAYIVWRVPRIVRVATASLSLAIFGYGGIRLLLLQTEKGTLADAWFWPVSVLAIGVFATRAIVKTTEWKFLAYEKKVVPIANRFRKFGYITGGTTTLCCLVWFMQYTQDQLEQYWWYVWPFAIPGMIWAVISLSLYWRKELTEPAQLEQERLQRAREIEEQEQAQESAELEEKWYYRYGMAIVMAGGGIWIATENEKLWWVGVIAFLCAAFYARELTIWLIVAGFVYWTAQGVAALPTSVAIILGACIIAAAIPKSNN